MFKKSQENRSCKNNYCICVDTDAIALNLNLLAGLGALFLVRTPIAALALYRAIADAAAAVAKL